MLYDIIYRRNLQSNKVTKYKKKKWAHKYEELAVTSEEKTKGWNKTGERDQQGQTIMCKIKATGIY